MIGVPRLACRQTVAQNRADAFILAQLQTLALSRTLPAVDMGALGLTLSTGVKLSRWGVSRGPREICALTTFCWGVFFLLTIEYERLGGTITVWLRLRGEKRVSNVMAVHDSLFPLNHVLLRFWFDTRRQIAAWVLSY